MKLANLEKAYELAPEFKGKMKAGLWRLNIDHKQFNWLEKKQKNKTQPKKEWF